MPLANKVADMLAYMEVDEVADMVALMFKTNFIKPEMLSNEVCWAKAVW